MRRRTVIAIIITAFIIFCTNQFWLNFKPMTVDFDILGNDNCNIEVQLNKFDNDKFEKIKSYSKKINLNKNKHISSRIAKVKYPKRLRIIISNIHNPIEIKNITLKNGKYKIDDLNKFSLNNGRLAVTNNTLVITPPSQKL